MEKKSILVADDERDILEMLTYALEKEGYQVTTAENGEETINKARNIVPNIVLLDIMMPKMDGIEVCRTLRQDSRFDNTYILILTARGEEYSEVAGFDAGADDYVVKPVKLRSLVKRLGALQRRAQVNTEESIDLGPFVIDREKYSLTKNGTPIKLPRKEFELLFLLAQNAGKVVKRDSIFQNIWGKDVIVVDRTIDVHIRRLRKKIGEHFIQTVKGVGYKFSTEGANL